MDVNNLYFLAGLIFFAALLYSSVGHGGASGYLAAMALFGLAPIEMKPAALTLNIVVASIGTIKYIKADRFTWSIFWPFALCSVPFAYLGGLINLPGIYYKPIVGIVLIYAAFRFVMNVTTSEYQIIKPQISVILISGAGLGFISGLVGVGGGIFLSPLLIMLQWEEIKKISGIAAAFILVNSIAGILGFISSNPAQLPEGIAIWAVAAVLGGYIGAEYGSKRLVSQAIKVLLALVLLLAGLKMIVTT